MFKGYFIAVIVAVWGVLLSYLGIVRTKENKARRKREKP